MSSHYTLKVFIFIFVLFFGSCGNHVNVLGSEFPKENLVVAQDGSGHFLTIGEALEAASSGFVIHVKEGVYKEYLNIIKENIKLKGEGIGKTIITGNKSFAGGIHTFDSATVSAIGSGFVAWGITFRNTAGPQSRQAVAFKSMSDRSVLYKCSFEGFQDTLYMHSRRQFYRECDIYGTVDFLFGDATAILQKCNIFARYSPTHVNTITAQGRQSQNRTTGMVIHNSIVRAASDLVPFLGITKTYLGRPWKEYSKTVFMKTYIDNLVDSRGWLEWNGSFALKTLYYAEFENNGPGATTSGRVKWPGYHVLHSASEASKYTVETFLGGRAWIPTFIPYNPGL